MYVAHFFAQDITLCTLHTLCMLQILSVTPYVTFVTISANGPTVVKHWCLCQHFKLIQQHFCCCKLLYHSRQLLNVV